jgi:hypothetical protein
MSELTVKTKTNAWLPPRWFIRWFWFAHRRLFRLTGAEIDKDLAACAARRSMETAVVILEPRP